MLDTKNMMWPNLADYHRNDLPESALVTVPNGLLKELKSARDAVRQALAPFAKIADIYDRAHEERVRHYADEGRDFGPPQPNHYLVSVSLGECRKARAALAAPVQPAYNSLTNPSDMGPFNDEQ